MNAQLPGAALLLPGHPASSAPLTPFDLVALALLIGPVVALFVTWGLVRVRRARAAIRAAVEVTGSRIVRMQYRALRLGPLFWTTTRGHVVYRLVVREPDGGQRTGWARWGRRWLLEPDTLEMRWDQ